MQSNGKFATQLICLHLGIVMYAGKTLSKDFVPELVAEKPHFLSLPLKCLGNDIIDVSKKLTWKNQPNKSQQRIRNSSLWVRCKQLGSPRPS